MPPVLPTLTPDTLRAHTLGADALVATPFGERPLVYADHTASGRQLDFVEDYLLSLAPLYANSHTEDSLTGRTATRLLHDAEVAIKRAVHAGPGGKVICCGMGSTAAVHKLQQILGVAIPPATLERLAGTLGDATGATTPDRVAALVGDHQPVVFVGPYEHHSNVVTWRESLCTTVEVDLTEDGQVDLAMLERALADPQWAGRTRIGSFSAASNVTGVVAPVHDLARLLHRYDALAVFDYAAGGPYLPIDMCPDGDPEAALDAIFLSPHKFLGGPGSSGLLVLNEALYPSHLAPSVGGGGTVDYVSPDAHDFTADIEAREKAGTPGLYQTLRAALALEVKAAIGTEAIHAREQEHVSRAFARWAEVPGIHVLGPHEASGRVGIVSFNVADSACGMLHPKLVTVLLNDLFGVQSRAGCSCAGPYGHRLLGIGTSDSERLRAASRRGAHGIKPGWCRVGFHYTMDADEASYVTEAVAFVAEQGACFLGLYDFDLASGGWTPRSETIADLRERVAPTVASGHSLPMPAFSLAAARSATGSREGGAVPLDVRRDRYAAAFADARALASALDGPPVMHTLEGDLAPLQFFALS